MEDVTVGVEVVGTEVVGTEVMGTEVVGEEVFGAEVVGADVTGAEVVGAEVVGADVTGSEVVGTEVVGADVTGAEVVGTEVVGADVDGTDVVGAVVANAGLFSLVTLISARVTLINSSKITSRSIFTLGKVAASSFKKITTSSIKFFIISSCVASSGESNLLTFKASSTSRIKSSFSSLYDSIITVIEITKSLKISSNIRIVSLYFGACPAVLSPNLTKESI